jgi:polar amino acid transport system substrate-binding protein
VVASALCGLLPSLAGADTLEKIQSRGRLIWGADSEGGGPYVYPDPKNPRRVTGFEVELAALLARELGVEQQFFQGPWSGLPEVLDTGEIDIILNGYELTPARAGMMLATQPYYIYELALLVRKDNSELRGWEDLGKAAAAGRGKTKVGVLRPSGAYSYLVEHHPDDVTIIGYEGNTDAMEEVVTGKLDATIADLPVAIFYRDRFPALHQVGPPAGRGYYVIYLRQGDDRLRDALNHALDKLLQSGELRAVYERYGLWSKTQDELAGLSGKAPADLGIKATRLRGWGAIRGRGPLLIEAAGMTVLLACVSMPLAMLLGLAVALGRMYGPAPVRWLMLGYVELLRGTPLMLQLFVIFFLPPEFGLKIPAIYAAIAGLAINYSAYEAEIYRAGIQAIPRGQMEAALALGMSPALALRRVVLPQAMRIVLPPVTNDFIAMFKDTSVCSVITVVELTKEYSLQINDTGATAELAVMTALLYLMMSVPLAHLSSRLEKRMRRKENGG